jgi:GT2 family glycosyltransferase
MDPTRIEYERAQAETAWARARARTTPQAALPWLERAYRFTPSDQNLAFSLATARMAAGRLDEALALFVHMARRHESPEILSGIAACAAMLGRTAQAREAVGRALARFVPDATIRALAARLAARGWCGVTLDGELLGAFADGAAILLDGVPVAAGRVLPPHWRGASWLRVVADPPGGAGSTPGMDVLGSPVDLRAVTRVEGFVELAGGMVRGWAWHPGDPAGDPVLTIVASGAAPVRITASDLSVPFQGTTPLARPRGFRVAAGAGTVRVLGPDGRDLWGSPLGGSSRVRPAPPPDPRAGIAIVVPVYRGLATTLACLRSVLATKGRADRLIVVNDASPDAALAEALGGLHAQGAITLIPSDPADPSRNRGFPDAANAGMLAARGADVVLLNSDTVVHAGWLAALRRAAHGAPDIGTATPFSNDATIFTYPDPANPGAMPDAALGAALAAAALAANAGVVVDVPTGHGFCLYIKAACLHATGLLRGGLFAQGYGEENDFCERARRRGWRHVAVPAVFVSHEGGVSFGPAKHHLLARNAAILDRLHPGYRRRVQDFIAADPLLPARARLDMARFVARAAGPDAVLLVSHAGHGGTARIVRERVDALHAQGLRPIQLRGQDGVTEIVDRHGDTPNLRFRVPEDAAALTGLLGQCRAGRAELHHLSGHGTGLAALILELGIPFDVWVHDYQWICARMTLVTGEGKFCGEPPVAVCDACVAQWGDAQEVPLTPAALRGRSAALLPRAGSVIAPSADVARRIRRHFPAASVREEAWEPDPPARQARLVAGPAAMLTVAVVGAIGMEKGYDTLLECARDAARRDLPLRYAVAGFTIDDTPLLDTGRVFVTGPFKPEAAGATIAGLGAQLAFLPSIWPETWCFALSDCWRAGLDAAVFDIGTPAERVRRTGRGWVLPLGLPPGRVNDVLLNLQGLASRS